MPQTPPFSAMFDSSGYNRNLYQSADDSCGGLYYHDNNLLSGSLEALIQHLVPSVDYYPDVGIPVPLQRVLGPWSLVSSRRFGRVDRDPGCCRIISGLLRIFLIRNYMLIMECFEIRLSPDRYICVLGVGWLVCFRVIITS